MWRHIIINEGETRTSFIKDKIDLIYRDNLIHCSRGDAGKSDTLVTRSVVHGQTASINTWNTVRNIQT